MHVTKDPHCPDHPRMAVGATWLGYPQRHGRQLPIWTCSVCKRQLGLASFSKDYSNRRIQFVRGRKPILSQLSLYRRDFNWMLNRGIDDTLEPHEQWNRRAKGWHDNADWLFK